MTRKPPDPHAEAPGRQPSQPSWYVPTWLVASAFIGLFLYANWTSRSHEIVLKLLQVGPFIVIPDLAAVTMSAWLGHGLKLLQLAWVMAALAGTGMALLRGAGPVALSRCEQLALAFGLGSGAWALAFLLLGLAGLLEPRLLLGLLLLGGAYGAWTLARAPKHGNEPLFPAQERAEAGFFALALFANLLMLWAYAAVPETFYDALEYHLGLPHLYLLQGRIGPVPDNAFVGTPSTASMLYGWTLTVDPDGVLAHLLNFSALAWIAAALTGLGARLGSATAGLAAAALFAAIPVASSSSFLTGVELWWTLYLLTSASALLAALELPEGDAARRRWLAVAGFLLGSGMASKYLAWAAPAAALALYAVRRREDGDRRIHLAEPALLCGVAAAVLLPWVLKNAAHYANPLYPFFHDKIAPSAEVMPSWRYMAAGSLAAPGMGWLDFAKEYLRSPWGMVYHQDNHSMSLGATFIAMVAFAALSRLSGPLRALRWFAVACWLPLSPVVKLPRYFLPAAAPLALVACLSLWNGFERPTRRLLAAALLLSMALSMYRFWGWALPRENWRVFSGEETKETFLSRGGSELYPSPPYPAVSYLAHETPPNAKVLLFGEARGFYIPRDHLLSTPGQATIVERVSNASSSASDIKERLYRMGVTHILVNYGELFRTNQPLRFSPAGKSNLDGFWARYTLKVFQSGPKTLTGKDGKKRLDHWLALYRVLDEEEAAKPHAADDLFQAFKVAR